jgi:acetyltransferase-like isoleucine patch superfamily enzyme
MPLGTPFNELVYKKAHVTIGKSVHVGAGSIILPGVTI